MFSRICAVDDVWDGEIISFLAGAARIVLVNVEGEFRAFDARCPHQHYSLAEGDLDGTVVTCPAHRWSFDVLTGEGVNPRGCRLTLYPVRIDGEDVLVDMDASDAAVPAGDLSA